MKNAKSYIVFKSNKKNFYLYDLKTNKILLCHPLFHHILKLHQDGVNIKNWLENLKDDLVKRENFGKFSKKEIEHSYNRYLILLSNGYFSGIDRKYRLSARIEPEEIKTTLANVRQIVFEVTDACNMQCEYCSYGKFYNH